MTDEVPNSSTNWVTAWYAAPTEMFPANLTGRTLRQIIHLHAGGEQLRLRLSNRYGKAPVTLSSVSVGNVLQGPIVAPNAVEVRFGGESMVTLQPGQEINSDSIALQTKAMLDLAITFYLVEGDILTGHASGVQTSYISGMANTTAIPIEASMFAYPLTTSSWWLITGVDVLASVPQNAVVAFGSSTTDGYGSTPNTNRRWPDYLARRLQSADSTRLMSVLNAGISGNQLTSNPVANAGMPGIPMFLFGDAGIRRFAWDVLPLTGATDLIVNIGSNDLRTGVRSEQIIGAFQQLAQQARQKFQRVFGSTILPGGYSPEQAKERQRVNIWLSEQGSEYFDAVFDFATPLTSTDNEALLYPRYDSGDCIHPNDEGYRLMAEAVNISLLTGNRPTSNP